jgi:energy-coupling factor transporter ATP-binding protein EcfA2
MTGEPIIDVRGLRYRYDNGTLALDGIDFRLFPGETVALLGPNGSGKTTFAHHLNGLLCGEGRISVCGLVVEKETLAAIRRKVGLVFQDSDEQLFMPSVLEDAAFGPLNAGHSPEQAERIALEALGQTGMAYAAAKAPYHLSAGEKTTFLDPPAQRDLVALLRGLAQAQILITHDAALARALATRAVFFERGKIVAEGPVAEILERFRWDAAAPAAGPA